jgi:hypothetical protein
MSRKFFASLAYGVLIAIPGLAQEDYTTYKSEVSVQGLGSFVKTTNDKGAQQSATNSGGVLASVRGEPLMKRRGLIEKYVLAHLDEPIQSVKAQGLGKRRDSVLRI